MYLGHLQTSTIKYLTKIETLIQLFLQKVSFQVRDKVQNVPLQMDTTQCLKFKWIYLPDSK